MMLQLQPNGGVDVAKDARCRILDSSFRLRSSDRARPEQVATRLGSRPFLPYDDTVEP